MICRRWLRLALVVSLVAIWQHVFAQALDDGQPARRGAVQVVEQNHGPEGFQF